MLEQTLASTFSNPEESSQGHEESLRLCINEKSRRTYIHVPNHHMGALYKLGLVYYNSPRAKIRKSTLKCPISESYLKMFKTPKLKGTYIYLNALSEI